MPLLTRRPRQRSIRALLALIFIVPLVSLVALWGFAASVTVSNAVQEHNFKTEDRLYGGAAQALGAALVQERLQAFIWLSSGRKASATPMLQEFHATNRAVAAFLRGVNAGPGMIPSSAKPDLAAFESALASLPSLRRRIESAQLSPLAAFQAYNNVADAQFGLYSNLVVVNNVSLYMQAAASVEAGHAVELATREITLIFGSMYNSLNMSNAERVLFAQTVANQRLLMSDAMKELAPSLASGYARANSSSAYATFSGIENRVIASIGAKGPIPVDPAVFIQATNQLFKDYQAAEAQDRLGLSSQGTSVGDRFLLELLLAGGLGLIAVVVSVLMMLRFGRRITRELTGLEGEALDLAKNRLPSMVRRLGAGEDVDVAAGAAPGTPSRIGEIAGVTQAFSSVQRTAVEAAVGQARLRNGVSQVFRNLAWRSQSLLHRQLALLDVMERKSTEPETLAELFALDHLTTRMRRHAEGLLILTGASPGRGWRNAVPVVDVLRGAVAEIEDYTRVNVITDSEDAIIGATVADVIHLLAELIENATQYSPAGTEVTVRAGEVARGIGVEVEDRGVGVTDEQLDKLNQNLASPPEFDLAEGDQLGLFVVARLAAKHGIKVTLRPSPFGGTSAIVLLPRAILEARSEIMPGLAADDLAGQEGLRPEDFGVEAARAEVPRSGGWLSEPPVFDAPASDAPVSGARSADPVGADLGGPEVAAFALAASSEEMSQQQSEPETSAAATDASDSREAAWDPLAWGASLAGLPDSAVADSAVPASGLSARMSSVSGAPAQEDPVLEGSVVAGPVVGEMTGSVDADAAGSVADDAEAAGGPVPDVTAASTSSAGGVPPSADEPDEVNPWAAWPRGDSGTDVFKPLSRRVGDRVAPYVHADADDSWSPMGWQGPTRSGPPGVGSNGDGRDGSGPGPGSPDVGWTTTPSPSGGDGQHETAASSGWPGESGQDSWSGETGWGSGTGFGGQLAKGSEVAVPVKPLPRRVRQASLAPQLKDDNSAGALVSADADETPTPAGSRTFGDSLGFGWQRARDDEAESDGAWQPPVDLSEASAREDREGT
jgi:signal transduction histidine kinase